MSNTKLPDLAEAVAEYINELYPGAGAKYNPKPYYKLERLTVRQIDVLPATLKRPRLIRGGRSRVVTVDVVIQSRFEGDAECKALTNFVDELLGQLLDKRFDPSGYISSDGMLSNDEVHNPEAAFDASRFESTIRVEFTWHPGDGVA